jgi:kynureninase
MESSLLTWRAEFPILETCNYLVSHSLGAMPRRTRTYLQKYADEWEGRGVRAWYEGWWSVGTDTGNILAPILGVLRGQAPENRDAGSRFSDQPLPL